MPDSERAKQTLAASGPFPAPRRGLRRCVPGVARPDGRGRAVDGSAPAAHPSAPLVVDELLREPVSRSILHICNGWGTSRPLEKSGVPGEVKLFCDVLLEGPCPPLEVVRESLDPERLSRVLLDGGEPIGRAAGFHQYGHVWELHPFDGGHEPSAAGNGHRLGQDLERLMAARGVDAPPWDSDEMDRTTAFGVDLYEDPARAITQLRTLREHP